MSRAASSRRCELYPDVLHHVALENPIDDVHSLDDLGEHRVVAVEAQVVLEIDEPLRVAGVAATRAHPDGPSHVWRGAELVAQVLCEADVLVVAGASSLNHEVVLHAVPAEAVVVAGPAEGENACSHHRRDVAAQPHDERATTARW